MKTRKVMVSICCAVYNHLPYLKQAIDGFLAQKTTFDYEIIISDDVSTDGSRELLREYQKKFPEKIRVLFQEKNQYSKGKKIIFDILIPEARGKYIAICEGDDYWVDPNKLQKQFDIMERETSCVFCVHKVQDVNADGELLGNMYPPEEMPEGLIVQQDFIRMLFAPSRYWFHTSSFFLRASEVKRFDGIYPAFIKQSGVGDVPLTWLLANCGDVYYIDSEMSCYRRDLSGSWSVRMQRRDYRRRMVQKQLEALKAYNDYTGHKYDSLLSEDIIKCEFDYFRLSNKFLAIKQKTYKKYYSRLSFVEKAKIFLLFLFPKIERGYESIQKRKRNVG